MRPNTALAALLVVASISLAPATAHAQSAAPARVRVELTEFGGILGPQPGSTLHLRATITNDSGESVDFVRWRLRRAEPLTTRTGVAQAADNPPAGETFWRKSEDVVRELAAGATQTVALDIPLAELDIPRRGTPAVYPLRFEVTSRFSTTLGHADTFLVWWPKPQPTLHVSWVVPLTDPPARTPAGAVQGDQLSASVAPGGRLDAVLAVLERANALSSSTLRLTLAVDGQLLQSVGVLADGTPGNPFAARWLARLRDVSRGANVIALPYADADIVALVRAGLSADVTVAFRQSREAIQRVLGVSPDTRIAWPVNGLLDTASVSVLADNGFSGAILDDLALPMTTEPTHTETAAADLDTTRRRMTALVQDSALAQLMGAPASLDAVTTTRQRLLAETAVIQQERPSDARDVVLPLPRLWLPPTVESSAAMLATPETAPWLASTTLTQILDQPTRSTDRVATPHYPDAARRSELPTRLLRDVSHQRADLLSFGTILVDPEEPSASDAAAVAAANEQKAAASAIRAQISTWREDVLAWTFSAHWRADVPAASALRSAVQHDFQTRYRAKVRVLLNKVRLTSTHGPVPITIVNELRTPVRVRLRLRAQRLGLTFGEVPDQTVAPTGAHLSAQFQARTIGKFPVEVALLTTENDALGPPMTTVVSTTAYGTVALAVTITAFVLLVFAIVVRFVFRRRRGGSASDDEGGNTDPPFPDDDPALAPLTPVGGSDTE